jgi:hypothetical protein
MLLRLQLLLKEIASASSDPPSTLELCGGYRRR